MAVSTWGMSLSEAVSLTEWQIDALLAAYLERKRFEAKVMLGVVGEALKPKEPDMSPIALAAMGFGIKGK